ncbi:MULTISPECIES: hypothetical protein [Serratia]|uniref:hypothetical protein n=1 Tax=Serratia TaxID=613 RepID=UPI000686E66F|nr:MULTISPECIES: hypothetical protein [Serratia]MBP1000098.1 hypothetical protein [Serratia fonticola]MBP1005044.1 hypothetical protein [Serratia fonticola]MBP1014819.1 hypothetical protein [Serratia fonticola]NYA44249.1 hypothetical protein [Serratia fonticola]QXN63412.1 hypothetical protein J8M99_04990 [Serratia fonticola]
MLAREIDINRDGLRIREDGLQMVISKRKMKAQKPFFQLKVDIDNSTSLGVVEEHLKIMLQTLRQVREAENDHGDICHIDETRFEAMFHSLEQQINPDDTARIILPRDTQKPVNHSGLVDISKVERGREHILAASEWLTAEQISHLAGFATENPSAQPSKWKSHNRIFSLKKGATQLFPRYALDDNYRPLPVMAVLLASFKNLKHGWGLAQWFATSNALLAGRRPMEMLQSYPANVIAAAEYEAKRIADGAEQN